MNTNRYKIQPPRINNIPITGYKRDYNDFNGSSDTPSTSSITSPISKPDIDSAHKNIKTNSFASHLPPLYKKQKSISSINSIRFGTSNVQLAVTPLAPQYSQSNVAPINIEPLTSNMCILPISITPNINYNTFVNSNNTNHSNINLDTLISQIGNLPNINTDQIQLLNKLILSSSNTNTIKHNNMMQVTNNNVQSRNNIIANNSSNLHTQNMNTQNINAHNNIIISENIRKSCHQCK
eukprot:326301_1